MAWPPPVLPINRSNATAQQDTHPQDHNAANQAVNDTVTKVQGMDNLLTGTGTGGMGQLGRVVYGSYPGGTIAPGTEAEVAYMTLPAGLWLVCYTVMLTSAAPLVAGVKMFNVRQANPFSAVYSAPLIGPTAAITPTLALLSSGAGRVSVNVGNDRGGTGAVSCYADPTNHQLFAVGLVP